MTLDDLLALLPDNSTGEIDAADLRAIVTELWNVANSQALVLVYEYVTSTAPALGKVNIAWTTSATTLAVSEQTSDGGALPVAVIDGTDQNTFVLANGDRSAMVRGTITGNSTDQGSYRTFAVTVTEVVGTQPGANTVMNLSVFVSTA